MSGGKRALPTARTPRRVYKPASPSGEIWSFRPARTILPLDTPAADRSHCRELRATSCRKHSLDPRSSRGY